MEEQRRSLGLAALEARIHHLDQGERDTREVPEIAGNPIRTPAERYAQIEQMSGRYKMKGCPRRSRDYDWLHRRRCSGTMATQEHGFAATHPGSLRTGPHQNVPRTPSVMPVPMDW